MVFCFKTAETWPWVSFLNDQLILIGLFPSQGSLEPSGLGVHGLGVWSSRQGIPSIKLELPHVLNSEGHSGRWIREMCWKQRCSSLEEMLKINLPTHLTYPPDFISSKWLTILFFNILRNKELTTFQGIFFFFFNFYLYNVPKQAKFWKCIRDSDTRKTVEKFKAVMNNV